MNNTGIVRDGIFLKHRMDAYNPEVPERLESIYEMLDGSGLSNELITVSPRPAEFDELEEIHTRDHIETIISTRGKERTVLDSDTMTSPGSCDAALSAAGGLCQAVSMVMESELDNAFALVRPPGHHAESSRAMGFCLFNNIAVAARYAQKRHGAGRVLIADWDLHHGNGTQHSFEEDSSILFFSSHQSPLYPGTGRIGESGTGEGEGYTVNVPCPSGFGDTEFVEIYKRILTPVAKQFKPDLVLVSAGFDTHKADPLGGMRVSAEGFGLLTGILMDIAAECCTGRLVLSLEGGYDLEGLTCSVKSVLNTLLGRGTGAVNENAGDDGKHLNEFLSHIKSQHSRKWSF